MTVSAPEVIVPKKVLSASKGADRDADSGTFTLSNGKVSEPTVRASIVFDYEICIGGIPFVIIERAHGNGPIQLQAVYSETIGGIDCETGDGPFFFFSNAMDCYRNVAIKIDPSESQQTIKANLAQRSQRYLKLVLISENASVVISRVGVELVRPFIEPKASFHCSDETLNRIWRDGVRTVDMCTVLKGETAPSWEVTNDGTRVLGQHWAPCRQGTRWGDKEVTFEVQIEHLGASWGVHMVANGVIFCLDIDAEELRAYEGLADQSAVFPVKSFGSWSTHGIAKKGDWIRVSAITKGNVIAVTINDREVATIADVQLRPILGGSGINTGSVAFGGPNGWLAVYRNLAVKGAGEVLYENSLRLEDKDRTLADFQVGTNAVACMIDGAKRDRATFGGDLFVSGRGVAYAGLDMAAVAGSIELLSSHQTEDGYLGNLCPIQAPIHTGDAPPPTYAFYSMTYACLLVVAVKDYWLHSGDDKVVQRFLPAAENLLKFAESHLNPSGLIEVHPELSMHWYPLGGPVFGAAGTTNLAYYDALNAVIAMTSDSSRKSQLAGRAESLKRNILHHLWNPETCSIRMGMALPSDGICQDTNGYALSLGITSEPEKTASHLACPSGTKPVAFKGLNHWDRTGVISPYATGFAVEALFSQQKGQEAIKLIESVWGPMADTSSPNYSGGHWEAMTAEGKPFYHDTSLMHAWSSWPVFLLPQYVAGVRPLEPGWTKIQVAPVLSGISSAHYQKETSSGKVEVDLNVDEGAGKIGVTLSLPPGVSAELLPPPGYINEGDASLQGPVGKKLITFQRAEIRN
ncbi:hypothetical protein CGCSCA4_v012978 [Colletotrichum siamense]|nr:hypothetical protein CGCSCA4_v012978 [Colletotrichum siamense]